MDPIELGRTSGLLFFKAHEYVAAALVAGTALQQAPESDALIIGFGAAVAGCEGQLVKKPFVHWSTRIFKRVRDPEFVELARGRLAELATKPEYLELPPMEPSDIEPLLAFLDVQPSQLMADAVEALAADDRMFAMIALGELGSPRFASAIAGGVSGRWGQRAACAALKRIRPYAAHRAVRDALIALRASPLAEECEPYLGSAERGVAQVPVTITVPEGYVKVVEPPAVPAKPWWKLW